MGRDLKQEALTYLLELAEKNGYVTFDNIMNCADEKSLSIQDFDWLSSAITTRGIIVYDEAPTGRTIPDHADDEVNDYAQTDYESIYDRIIEIDDSLEPFITEVRNIKPPQWKELSQLEYLVLEGNEFARTRMIEMHLRIALRIALQKSEIFDMDIVDAIGEACVGLVTAVDKYDPDNNGAFGSYAGMWILQNIGRRQPTRRALMYYPVHKKESFFIAYPLLKEKGYFEEVPLIDKKEANDYLQYEMGISYEEARDILLACTEFESFEKMYFEDLADDMEDDHDTPEEFIAEDNVEEAATYTLLKKHIDIALSTLKEREKLVLQLRFGLIDGEERILEDVGNQLGVTRERVRQIEAKALRKLRHPSISIKLKDFLD